MALTSLTNVKSWLGVTLTTDDTLLTNLINQISLAISNYLQRPNLSRSTYTELRSGVGNSSMMLRNWPVVSVTSVAAGQTTISASSGLGLSGYTLSTWDGTGAGTPQSITLNGYRFTRGQNNIQIVYEAGYCIEDEAQTVPASVSYTITPTQPYGNFVQDDGVTLANGTALTKVTGSPATGQYSVSSTGVYTFNSAQASAAVLISYSYTPAPIEEACIEWVGERYRYKQRIGQTSQSVGGQETAAYSLKMPEHIQIMLKPYKKELPL
jgi:hypothetical protein